MKNLKIIQILFLALGFGLMNSACFVGGESASEGDTVVDIIEEPAPGDNDGGVSELSPEVVVCNPFPTETSAVPVPAEDRKQGIRGRVVYLEDWQPRYEFSREYLQFGTPVENIVLYINQLFVPTRPFDRGFFTESGKLIKTKNGDTLYEYFAMDLQGKIKLGPEDVEGAYQFAVLSDDGALLSFEEQGRPVTIVDNDGVHPTRMGCSMDPVTFTTDTEEPFRLTYYQGPRYHIAMALLWRPWPASQDEVDDPECGEQGNYRYWDFRTTPPTPTPRYEQLLSRGWKVLSPENFVLPSDEDNPCQDIPAPTITELTVQNITKTGMTVLWNTDVLSTSQVRYINVFSGEEKLSPIDTNRVVGHVYELDRLKKGSRYEISVISVSGSGKSSESSPLIVNTLR